MYLKVMDVDGRNIVAVCDRELLGQKVEEGESILDLELNRHFYEGKVCRKDAVLSAITMADSVNLVGERAVGAGIEAGLVSEGSVAKIGGIPHAQSYRL